MASVKAGGGHQSAPAPERAMTANEQPVGWRVSALDGRNDSITGFKKQPHTERFTDRAAADARKQALQGAGMVAQ
jgi:hypothetical protein